ncbi:MAG: trigger factor, partial [Nitrospira sp. SB0661_bin_20]|nr:trigger factor [Nitrospira sp. SB0661_bin_20]
DVDKALDRFRAQQAKLDAAPPGTLLAEGLYAVVRIEGVVDGEPVEGSKKEGHLHKVGSQEPVLGLVIDDALVGKQEGDHAELQQEYAATHPDARLAGKVVTFHLSVLGVKQKILPPLDDEFAKDCGEYENLDALKDMIRSELESVLKRDIEEGYKDRIMERLLEMHHFDLPETLVEREIRTLVRQRVMEEQRKKGGKFSMDDQIQMEEQAKRIQQEVAPGAQKRVKLALVLEAIADKEGISVSEQEIEEELTNLAKGLQVPLDDIRKMVESGGESSLQEFEDRIRAEKALQLVYQFAVIQG